MTKYQVYKITNKENGKIYIGITNRGIQERFFKHCSDARNGSTYYLHNAMRKYGLDNFQLELLEDCEDIYTLKDREKYWIEYYQSTLVTRGYNMTLGGDGTFGRKHSQETKDKIGSKATGRKVSEETKAKMSASAKGKVKNAEWAAKIVEGRKRLEALNILVVVKELETGEVRSFKIKSEVDRFYNLPKGTTAAYFKRGATYGNKLQFINPTVETRIKNKIELGEVSSERQNSNIRKYVREIPYVDRTSEEYLSKQRNHPGCKEVGQYDLEGNLLNTYKSANEAIRATGISRNSLKHAIKGRNTTGGGFIWKYLNE